MEPLYVSGAVAASYLGLYTAYSKQTKALSLDLLLDVLLVRRNLDFTLVEYNKAISLTGLTVLCLAFLPWFAAQRWALMWHAMVMLWAHAAYSVYKYYGTKMMPGLGRVPHMKLPQLGAPYVESMKLASLLLAGAAQTSLSAGYWQWIGAAAWCAGAVGLGTAHFFTMEIDYRGVLQVRPYAYLPFLLAAAALGYLFV